MLISELLRRDKVQRFVRVFREEGPLAALRQTRRYLRARLAGNGLTGLQQIRSDAGCTQIQSVWQDLSTRDGFHVGNAPAVLRKRRSVAMIGDLNLPQCRKYRVEQLDEIWTRRGVDYEFSHFADLPRAVNLMQDATHLMLYRLKSGPVVSTLMYEARRLRLPILYDIDDPLFSVSAYATYGNMAVLPKSEATRMTRATPEYLDAMNAADVVSVSTPGLAAHAALYCPRPIWVRRNFVDRASLTYAERALGAASDRSRAAGLRLGFASGSRGHEADFNLIAPQVFEFLRGGRENRLVILGHFDKRVLPAELLSQIDLYAFADYPDYLARLASVDCLLLPLADDLFNRCKSGARALDAASVGVPVLASAVGDLSAVVEPGTTGDLMRDLSDWLPALHRIRQNTQDDRRRIRDAVHRRWRSDAAHQFTDSALIDWVCA